MALFGRLAEIAGEYLKKGSQVYIEGSLRTRKWQDKQGNERYSTEIVGNELQMLGGRGGAGRWPGAGAEGGARATWRLQELPRTPTRKSPAAARHGGGGGAGGGGSKGGSGEEFDDDIPF